MRADRSVSDMDNVLATQMDYVYWSSPVVGQNIRSFSVGTPWNQRFEYNQEDDYFVPTSNLEFIAGKGYALRAETPTAETSPEVVNGTYDKTYKFRGVPNNGDINYMINRTNANGSSGIGYNLVGNPYPSNIDFDELYELNNELIFKTAWFWTNATYTQYQQGSGYSGNNYAVYNATGGNSANYTVTTGTIAPNAIIKVGQGFIIQKKTTGTGNLQFKNKNGSVDIRVSTPGTNFYHRSTQVKNRFWLQLISPIGLVNTQLIGYVAGATDGYEQDYDAEIFGLSSDIFYSVLNNKRLNIQGKADAFSIEDTIPIGANIYQNGTYTIALMSPEGIFAGGQTVYLHDKLLGEYADLSQNAYVFTAVPGITEGRFEVVYEPEATLTVNQSSIKNAIEVFRNGDDFIVRSSKNIIKGVDVFDSSGRLIYKSKAGSKEVTINSHYLANGVYVLRIETDQGITNRKVIK